jgi:tetratricopeptide (TPR) repeat protein
MVQGEERSVAAAGLGAGRMKWWRLAAVAGVSCASLLSSPVLAKCQVNQIAELSVTMSDMQPMVSAQINGVDARFMADSGAFFSLITAASAAQYHLRLTPAPANFWLKGVGGDASVSVATVKTFTLAGVPLPHVQFIVGGSESGSAGVGLLGQNVLGIGDAEYDLAHGAIRLMRPHDCNGANLAYWSGDRPVSVIDIEPRSPARPHTIGTVLLNGVKIRAIFDTGAGSSILSLTAASRAGIKPDSPGVRSAGYDRGLGRHITRTWIAPFVSFKVGGEEIRNTHLRIGDIGLDDVDMLIGADFFLSHRVYVANSQHKLFFTYDGGPVFNLVPRQVLAGDGTPLPASANADVVPTDAEGFSRRGAAFASRREFDRAIADLTKACEMAPTEGRYFYQRAMAYLGNHQPFLAMSDLDQTVKLSPNDIEARLARARLRIEGHDRPAARADLDAAAGVAPLQSDLRLQIGEMYSSMDAFDQAIAQYDPWIQNHPEDSRKPDALNSRCWTRALLGHDLDKALADCNAALRARPHTAAMLDSRGLVYLRLGDLDKAIADYDAALVLAPRIGWSLYGRGLAKQRKGMKAEGDADIAAAVAINPRLPDRVKLFGIAP